MYYVLQAIDDLKKEAQGKGHRAQGKEKTKVK